VAPVPPEPSLGTVNEPPLNPQPKAGDQKPFRRGMRGTGTSPREERSAQGAAAAVQVAKAEADRLVTAIPETYAHLPEDYVVSKIAEAFPDDVDRRQASLNHYRSLQAVAS
jgi:hypothetical protein